MHDGLLGEKPAGSRQMIKDPQNGQEPLRFGHSDSDQPPEADFCSKLSFQDLDMGLGKEPYFSKRGNDELPSKSELAMLGKSHIEEETMDSIFTRGGKSFQLRLDLKFSTPAREIDAGAIQLCKEQSSSQDPTTDKSLHVEEMQCLSITPVKHRSPWTLSQSARLLDSPDQNAELEGRLSGLRTARGPASPRVSQSGRTRQNNTPSPRPSKSRTRLARTGHEHDREEHLKTQHSPQKERERPHSPDKIFSEMLRSALLGTNRWQGQPQILQRPRRLDAALDACLQSCVHCQKGSTIGIFPTSFHSGQGVVHPNALCWHQKRAATPNWAVFDGRLMFGEEMVTSAIVKTFSPFRSVDATNLEDDFYKSLLDWSSQDVISVALDTQIYLWRTGHLQKRVSQAELLQEQMGLTDPVPIWDQEPAHSSTSSLDEEDTGSIVSGANSLALSHTIDPATQSTESDHILLEDWRASGRTPTCLRFNSSGTQLLVASDIGTVSLMDLGERRIGVLPEEVDVSECSLFHGRIGCCSWIADRVFLAGCADGSIRLGDLRTPKGLVSQVKAHEDEVCGLSWSTSLNKSASGSNDNSIAIWDIRKEETENRLKLHKAAVKALAWSTQERGVLYSGGGSRDRTLKSYHTSLSKLVSSVSLDSQVTGIVASPFSEHLVSLHGFSENDLKLWNANDIRAPLAKYVGHTKRVLHYALGPDGTTIVTGAGDETLKFWEVFPSDDLIQSDLDLGVGSPQSNRILTEGHTTRSKDGVFGYFRRRGHLREFPTQAIR